MLMLLLLLVVRLKLMLIFVFVDIGIQLVSPCPIAHPGDFHDRLHGGTQLHSHRAPLLQLGHVDHGDQDENDDNQDEKDDNQDEKMTTRMKKGAYDNIANGATDP